MKHLFLIACICMVTSLSFGQCEAAVDLVAEDNPICTGNSTKVTATPTNGGTSPTYEFIGYTFGFPSTIQDGSSNEATTETIWFGYEVEVIMTVNDGCAQGEEVSKRITIESSFGPNPIINEPGTEICDGNTYELTATVGEGSTYEWYKDGIATGNMTKKIDVTETGSYTIIEDDGACDPEESDPKTITVLDVPVVDAGEDVTVAPGNSVTLNGYSDYTSNVVWSPATDLDNPNSLTPVCTPENTRVYTLTSYNEQCAGSDQVEVAVSFLTSTETYLEQEFLLYPNPAKTELTIPLGAVEYYIYNAEGDMVSSGYGKQLNVSDFPEGLYSIMMNHQGEFISRKFTVIH